VMPELEMITRRAMALLEEAQGFIQKPAPTIKCDEARVAYLREESAKLWERLIKVAEKHDG
jgi:hypothetical protein